MVSQFIKILTAVIVIKITGYALIVTLLLHKIEIGLGMKFMVSFLLCSNFALVWHSFKQKKNWPLLASFANFFLTGAILALAAI
jgi:hypothetical protein